MYTFKNNETEREFIKWIKNYPESENPYDRKRFYDFIYSYVKNKETIKKQELAEIVIDNTTWIDNDFIDEFVDKKIDEINNLKEIFDYLLTLNRIILK